jgi:hypothetical protein
VLAAREMRRSPRRTITDYSGPAEGPGEGLGVPSGSDDAAHHLPMEKWPVCHSGPIADAPGETWGAVNQALYLGVRGFPGGSSLSRLLRAVKK